MTQHYDRNPTSGDGVANPTSNTCASLICVFLVSTAPLFCIQLIQAVLIQTDFTAFRFIVLCILRGVTALRRHSARPRRCGCPSKRKHITATCTSGRWGTACTRPEGDSTTPCPAAVCGHSCRGRSCRSCRHPERESGRACSLRPGLGLLTAQTHVLVMWSIHKAIGALPSLLRFVVLGPRI